MATIVYRNVRFSEQGIVELDGSAIMSRIPRAEIERIEFGRGSESKHPIVQILLGVIFCIGGSIGYLALLASGLEGGKSSVIVLLLIPGTYLVIDAIVRRPLLLVRTSSGLRRVALRGKLNLDELDRVLKDVSEAYGYCVSSVLPDAK